jgi:DNA-binding CsgD family transcriptional regulator
VRAQPLVGRQEELACVDSFLDAAKGGLQVLAVTGQAGIGKTAVWQEGLRRAEEKGFRVLSARPSGAEAKLSFAGLADLVSPVPGEALEQLAPPQRRALEVALLHVDAGDDPLDSHAVSSGLLSLLRSLAAEQPLVLAVDDAQWLDAPTAEALGFAVRRMHESPVAVLASVRVQPDRPETFERAAGAERRQDLELTGLSVAAIHEILRRELGVSFPRPTLIRVAGVSGGNPFFALEIGRELARAVAPAAGRPLPLPLELRVPTTARLDRLPEATREALLVAAAASRPTTALVDVDALAPAEQAGIIRVDRDGSIRFEHPLLASAVYDSAPEAHRRRVHRELAEQVGDAEERARHLALAAEGPDAETAEALDRAAELVASRGAAQVAVELKGLALQATPPGDAGAAVRRRQELAERLYFAGDASGARRELESLASSLPAGEGRAGVLLDLGSVVWTQGEGDQGLALLSQSLSEAATPALQARIHSRISLMAEDCDLGLEHAESALALTDERSDPLLYSFALHNVARMKLYAAGQADHDAVERGMRLQEEAAGWEVSAVPAYWARDFDDFDTARSRFEDLLRVFRERGDEARGCAVLAHLAVIEAMTGRVDRARALATEARELAEQTEQETWQNIALWAHGQVCVQLGELEEARRAAEAILGRLVAHPDAIVERMAREVLGVAACAGGDYEVADRELSRADAIDEALHVREPAAERFHADHAEAVIALGDLDRAETLVRQLEERAERLPRPWICAVAARSRGLLLSARGDLDGSLAAFERALGHHEELDMPLERGRTLLVLGQLLRRRKERRKARELFQDALVVFVRVEARQWAERARGELARVPVRRAPSDLTPTETTIASLAATGLTNRAIAERIYVSPKTVESNLARVYRKLGIHSRAELGRAMAERERMVET